MTKIIMTIRIDEDGDPMMDDRVIRVLKAAEKSLKNGQGLRIESPHHEVVVFKKDGKLLEKGVRAAKSNPRRRYS